MSEPGSEGHSDIPRFMESGQPALEWALQTLAEDILRSVVPDGDCSVQDWDNSLYCQASRPGHQDLVEMLPLATLTSASIRAAGERLKELLRD